MNKNQELLKKFIEQKDAEPHVTMRSSVIGWLVEFAVWLDEEDAKECQWCKRAANPENSSVTRCPFHQPDTTEH